MKTMKTIICNFWLVLIFVFSTTVALYGTAPVDCDELSKEIGKIEKKADALQRDIASIEKEARKKAEALETAFEEFDNLPEHGPDIAKMEEDAIRKINDAYTSWLKKADELHEAQRARRDSINSLLKKLEQWKKDCLKGNEQDLPGINGKIEKWKKEKPGAGQAVTDTEADALEKGKKAMGGDRRENESEEAYRKRLEKRYAALMEKWNHRRSGLDGKTLPDKTKEKLTDEFEEKTGAGREEEAALPGRQQDGAFVDAFPGRNPAGREPQQTERRPVFSLAVVGGFFSGTKGTYFGESDVEGLYRATYDSEETLSDLLDALGGEFYFGAGSMPLAFSSQRWKPGAAYGLEAGLLLNGRWRLEADLERRQGKMTADFPVTVFSLEDGTTRQVTGHLHTEISGWRAGLSGVALFGAGNWQPYAGAGLDYYRQMERRIQAGVSGVHFAVGEGRSGSGLGLRARAGVNGWLGRRLFVKAEVQAGTNPLPRQEQVTFVGGRLGIGWVWR